MSEIQLSRRGRVAIALLGNGQRDDPDRRISHGVEHRIGTLGRDQDRTHGGTDAQCLAVRTEFTGGVGAALGNETVAQIGITQADSKDAPVAAGFLHRFLDIERGEGAEECAEAQMDDADGRVQRIFRPT